MKNKNTNEFMIIFLFKKKNVREIIILLFFLINFSSCSPFRSDLDQLGKSDYNDVNINPDFSMDDFENLNNNGTEVTIIKEPQQVDEQSHQILQESNTSFMVEDQFFALVHGKALRWKGCYTDQKAMGGYVIHNNCGDAFLHKDFYNNLNHVFFRCIKNSAQVAGYGEPVKVFIHHLGTYNDNSQQTQSEEKLSLHALASAMDVVKFELFDSSGGRYEVFTSKRHYSGSQAVFYDEFRDCWKDSLPEKCTPEKSEYQGSIGHTASKLGGSSLSNDHLHLSLPYCAMTDKDTLSFISTWQNSLRNQGNHFIGSSLRTTRSSNLSHDRVFNCDNTLYRTQNYLRHSCLKSMNLEEKAALVMEDAFIINSLRQEFYLDPRFSFCVSYRESGIAPNALGSSNDYGMYQVTNSTAREVLRMHEPVLPVFAQYRNNQSKYRRAMLGSTLAQTDLHHSVMFAKAKHEGLVDQINRNPENVYLLKKLATSYNGSGRRARMYGAKVARCYEFMKQAVSRTGQIQNPSGVRAALMNL